jgi:hypothetical protein
MDWSNITKEDLNKAKQWKDLAEEYKLSMFEMFQLVYHLEEIKKLMSKKNAK